MASRLASVDFRGVQILACQVFLEEVISKATPETVNFVRDYIDQQTADLVKGALREWCAEELYLKMSLQQQPSVDIFAVMDCILDIHFKSLRVCLPSPASFSLQAFSNLMVIIAHRCPNLEELQVKFQDMEETLYKNKLYTSPSGSQLLLPCLGKLRLMFPSAYNAIETQETSESFLTIVGKLCPVLWKLYVEELCMNKLDVLGLIVNAEMSNILFRKDGHHWNEDSVLSGLRIPAQFLNPLVSTMKELAFCRTRASDHDSLVSALAFALRHGLNLDDWHVAHVRTSNVVKLLYQQRNVDEKLFEEAWKETASRLGLDVALPVTLFSGPLSLKKLKSVSSYDIDVLRAVSKLCTSIQKVEFLGYPKSLSLLSASQLEEIWKNWSNNIETIEIVSTDANFMMTVLKIFGPQIKNLVFGVEFDVDMHYLASNCANLETIDFLDSKFLDSEAASDASRWTPETFLPKLKKVYRTSWSGTEGCLGVWGLLIEKKSTLAHLALRCCHFGTNAHNPRLEWSELPKRWTQLESLQIGQCTGLTMATLLEILPQCPKLTHVYLPSYSIPLNHHATLKRKLEEKGINIYFTNPLGDSIRCYFQHV